MALDYVNGPADGVSTDNALVRWDGATGRLVQNSTATLSDAGLLQLPVAGSVELLNVAGANSEMGRLAWSGNELVLSTDAAGSGTLRALRLRGGTSGGAIVLSASGTISMAAVGGTINQALALSHATWTSTSLQQSGITITGTVNQASGTGGYNGVLVNPTLTAVGSGGARLFRGQVGAADRWFIDNNGKTSRFGTITAGGTTGNQTINKPSGTVNVAAAGTGAVVTNSLVTASSQVRAFLRTNDATAKSAVCVAAAGSFEIFLNAAATGEVSIGFLVEEIV